MIFPFYVGDTGHGMNSSWPLLLIIMLNLASYVGLSLFVLPDRPDVVRALYHWVATEGNNFPHLVLSTFFHGSPSHLFFNMWFLWLFALPLVNGLRSRHFFFLYFTAGIFGTWLQDQLSEGGSLGASGAIAGMMGFFLTHFMSNRVTCLLLVVPIALPAWILIGFFIGRDLYGAWTGSPHVGYWAHLGGTAVGILTGLAVTWHDRLLLRRRSQ